MPGIQEPTTNVGFADIHEEDVAAVRPSGVWGAALRPPGIALAISCECCVAAWKIFKSLHSITSIKIHSLFLRWLMHLRKVYIFKDTVCILYLLLMYRIYEYVTC